MSRSLMRRPAAPGPALLAALPRPATDARAGEITRLPHPARRRVPPNPAARRLPTPGRAAANPAGRQLPIRWPIPNLRAPVLVSGMWVGHNVTRKAGARRAGTGHLRVPRPLGKTSLVYWQGGQVSVRGVLQVHSAPPALSPHVEGAVSGALGAPVTLPRVDQPASPGPLRAPGAAPACRVGRVRGPWRARDAAGG